MLVFGWVSFGVRMHGIAYPLGKDSLPISLSVWDWSYLAYPVYHKGRMAIDLGLSFNGVRVSEIA